MKHHVYLPVHVDSCRAGLVHLVVMDGRGCKKYSSAIWFQFMCSHRKILLLFTFFRIPSNHCTEWYIFMRGIALGAPTSGFVILANWFAHVLCHQLSNQWLNCWARTHPSLFSLRTPRVVTIMTKFTRCVWESWCYLNGHLTAKPWDTCTCGATCFECVT